MSAQKKTKLNSIEKEIELKYKKIDKRKKKKMVVNGAKAKELARIIGSKHE